MRWREADGIEWLEERLSALPGARVAFSTRRGGVSDPPFGSLNLGVLTGDDRDAVLENRRLLAGALGLEPTQVAIARQVHGTELLAHTGPQRPSPFTGAADSIPDADGHVLRGAGEAALVFVADCLPIALAGPGGAAILHCGWRGLADGIVERGAAAVGATEAAIGPGIGSCCYEVGEEVLARFERLGPGIAVGDRLDLAGAAERLLRAAGVSRVRSAGICTSCEEERFFSHRRDQGRTGRQAGVVWREGG